MAMTDGEYEAFKQDMREKYGDDRKCTKRRTPISDTQFGPGIPPSKPTFYRYGYILSLKGGPAGNTKQISVQEYNLDHSEKGPPKEVTITQGEPIQRPNEFYASTTGLGLVVFSLDKDF